MSTDKTMDLALEHYSSGRLQETEGLVRQILKADPQHAPALHLLGVIALQTGHRDAAIELIRHAISINGRIAEYYSNLGVALTEQGRVNEAVTACARAVALNPNLAEGHYNLGNALRDARLLDRAEGEYRQAIAIRFDYPQAHNNLGSVAKEMGQLEQAAAAYRQAFTLRPDYAHACSNLGNTLKDMGRLEDAMDAHRRATEIAPARPEIHSNLLLCLQYPMESNASMLLEEARRWNERHAEPLRGFMRPHDNDRDPDRTLRVGIVSPDLRMHSVAFFLEPLLEAHDARAIHVTCYTTEPRTDEVTARLSAHSDAWSSLVGVSDDAAVERIREDRIDILLDVCGHTSGSRLPIFARKPAPLQVTYLGFPGSTGLDAIDYRLTDADADPPGAEIFSSERLLRVPQSAWCFAPLSGSPPVSELPASRNGHVTFGSFNAFAKVTPYTMRLWVRILREIPTSRLLVKSVAFRGRECVRRFQDFFADNGIGTDRIELIADEPSQLKHLQQYDRVDIALDTFPYHGVTTTCEALWMGVPVITLAGHRHASRVGVSLLTHAGHPEWIASTADAYVQRTQELAGDLGRLSDLRSGLRASLRASPLMDARGFASRIEVAFRDIWRQWCADQPAPPSS